MRREAVLICNPSARGRRAELEIADFAAQLRTHGLDLRVMNTMGPGEAADLAARASREGDTDIIISGGDGTINEALQGLIGTKARLGIWPGGTANVLACELGLPRATDQVAEIIGRGKTRQVHIGCAIEETSETRRYFLLMAGIGLDASIVSGVRPRLKQKLGKGAFWFSGFEHLARWGPGPFLVEVNGESFPATFASIGKAASYGGGLAVTPRAEIDKPEFEILVADCHSRLRFLQLFIRAISGSEPVSGPGIAFRRTAAARAIGKAPVQVDGELVGELPMRFEIAPWTIEVIVP